MVCGLSEEELFILNALYRHHCFSHKKSKNLGEIIKAFRTKFAGKDHEEAVRNLVNRGYISPKRKIDIKYYISSMAMASFALNLHGFNGTPGRIHKL